MTVDPIFDHMAKAEGQTVHCDRAAFFATGGIPYRVSDRILLGCALGFGFVMGGVAAAGIISLISKAFKLLFA